MIPGINKNKRGMIKDSFFDAVNLNISEDLINEIIILYSLGVGVDDLKYFLSMKLNES